MPSKTALIGASALALAGLGYLILRKSGPSGVAGAILDELDEVAEEVKNRSSNAVANFLGNPAIQGTARTTAMAIAGSYLGPQGAQAAGAAWDATEPVRDLSHEVTGRAVTGVWKQVSRIGGLF